MRLIKHKLCMTAILVIVLITIISCDRNDSNNKAINSEKFENTGVNADLEQQLTPIPADETDMPYDVDGKVKTQITEKPLITEKPQVDERPQVTEKKPLATDKPKITNKPQANEKPQINEEAQVPGKPQENEKPPINLKPQITESPQVPEKPQTAEKPHKSEDPQITEKSNKSNNTNLPSDNINSVDEAIIKRIIAIDAGHQSKGNYEKEPIGPGAKSTKAKVSSGTQGAFTRVPEYKLNLVIAQKVKDELIKRGYEVVMIRESHDVNLSNKERADIANESGADIFIRIHANGSTNSSVNGTSTLYPSKKNPYVADLSDASFNLSKAIVDSISENTGSKNRGAVAHDDMSGINWSSIPVTIIEMGYMTNEKEDRLMQTEDYQDKLVKGICDGIDNYYE